MKKKTFILTLMMMLCSFVYGQTHYWPEPVGYENSANIACAIKINGVSVNDARYELGAFCGDELRGSQFLNEKYLMKELKMTFHLNGSQKQSRLGQTNSKQNRL